MDKSKQVSDTNTFSNQKFTTKKGFVVAIIVFLVGFCLDLLLSPFAYILPTYPTNLILMICLIVGTILLLVLFRKKPVFDFLASVKAAVPAICLFTGLIILIGLFPQESTRNQLNIAWIHCIKSTWAFYLSGFFVLIVLLATIIKRMKIFKLQNIGFVLNHMGIAIVLVGAGFGASDYEELSMTLIKGQAVWYATNLQNEQVELDFALEMQDFELEYHLPLIKIESVNKKRFRIIEIDTSSLPQQLVYKGLLVEIDSFIFESVKKDKSYTEFCFPGSVSAARINLSGNSLQVDTSFWVCTGSSMFNPEFYSEQGLQIAILPPAAKTYITRARLYQKHGNTSDIFIKVNKPATIGEYKVYQQSYDITQGKYSEISILNIVKDPWLNFVYVGIFMIMFGVIFLFILGKKLNLKK